MQIINVINGKMTTNVLIFRIELIHLLYYALTFVYLIMLCVCSLQETYLSSLGSMSVLNIK